MQPVDRLWSIIIEVPHVPADLDLRLDKLGDDLMAALNKGGMQIKKRNFPMEPMDTPDKTLSVFRADFLGQAGDSYSGKYVLDVIKAHFEPITGGGWTFPLATDVVLYATQQKAMAATG